MFFVPLHSIYNGKMMNKFRIIACILVIFAVFGCTKEVSIKPKTDIPSLNFDNLGGSNDTTTSGGGGGITINPWTDQIDTGEFSL